jgi:hypothetical protein
LNLRHPCFLQCFAPGAFDGDDFRLVDDFLNLLGYFCIVFGVVVVFPVCFQYGKSGNNRFVPDNSDGTNGRCIGKTGIEFG